MKIACIVETMRMFQLILVRGGREEYVFAKNLVESLGARKMSIR